MATFELMQKEAKAIEAALDEILKMKGNELYGSHRLHDLSFDQHGKAQFLKIFSLLEDLRKCNLERVPVNFLQPIKDQLQRYKDIFAKAKNLDLNDNTPKQTRDAIVNEAENNYQTLFQAIVPVISFADKYGTDFKNLEHEAKNFLVGAQATASAYQKEIEINKKEAERILNDMRITAAESGVSQNALHYSEAEKNHETKASNWYLLGKRLLLGLVAFIAISSSLFAWLKGGDTPRLSYLEVAFLLLVSLWTYAILFCRSNFQAEKHNETVNSNKARSLTTFRAFVDGTESTEVKNVILQFAGASAFSNPISGYLKDESEIPLPPIIQTTRALANDISKLHGNA